MFSRFAIFIFCFTFLVHAVVSVKLVAQDKPNVVLVVTDDQGWWDVGVNGNKFIQTPIMDQLAREGVRFTNFYASPVCAPTRASLMTGRHYQRTGVFDTYKGRFNLHDDEVTLGDVFRSQGYRTALVGKWHLGQYMKHHPVNRGFNEFFGPWPYEGLHRYLDPDELYWNTHPVRTTGYITDVLNDQAISFIEQNRNRPFFLYLAHNAPHSPFRVPDKYVEKYLKKGLPLREAKVYGMITSLDENLGRLLKTIDQVGIRKNTVVIFMSDNGGVSRHFRAGLRGEKGTVYEGGIRVPFIVRWPGEFPVGATVQAMAQHIDLFPTLCQLIGATLPNGLKVDGKSILSLLRKGDGESPHEYMFHQWNRVQPLFSLPTSKRSLTVDPADQGGFRPNWAVRDSRGYKLVRFLMSGWGNSEPKPELQLFDLESDPGETRNISTQHPGIVRELYNEFEKWFADVTRDQDYFYRDRIQIGRQDENPVPIEITWGESVGKKVRPTYHGDIGDTIDDWSETEDLVRWKLDVVRAGNYEVLLSYGCRRGDEGSKFYLSAGHSRIEHTVRKTGGRGIFRRFVVGTLNLGKGPTIFEIKPLSIVGREVMALHRIWLKRLP